GEGVKLINHRVDCVLQFEDFTLDLDGDLLRQVAVRHGFRDFGDITHLPGQVTCHRVHVVGHVFPDTCDTLHVRLTAQLALGTDFAGHARYFRREGVKLINHDVDCVLQFQNFAAHVNGDFLGQVAIRNRRGNFGDITDLPGQVACHR